MIQIPEPMVRMEIISTAENRIRFTEMRGTLSEVLKLVRERMADPSCTICSILLEKD